MTCTAERKVRGLTYVMKCPTCGWSKCVKSLDKETVLFYNRSHLIERSWEWTRHLIRR